MYLVVLMCVDNPFHLQTSDSEADQRQGLSEVGHGRRLRRSVRPADDCGCHLRARLHFHHSRPGDNGLQSPRPDRISLE